MGRNKPLLVIVAALAISGWCWWFFAGGALAVRRVERARRESVEVALSVAKVWKVTFNGGHQISAEVRQAIPKFLAGEDVGVAAPP